MGHIRFPGVLYRKHFGGNAALYKHSQSHLSILLQEDLFSSANSNRAVASNEDDAIELMMYRQSGLQSEAAPAPMSGSQESAEPLPDELGPAERGEAPPLREVKTCVFRILTNISCGCF